MAPHQTHVEDGEPSLYEILAITPKHLEGQAAPAQARVVKKAYHRALLQNHPDKAGPLSRNSSSAATTTASPSSPRSPLPGSSTASPKPTSVVLYTVDQIQRAYNVLSDVRQRAEYNRDLTLRRQQNLQSPSSSNNNNGGNGSYFSFSHSTRGQGSSSSSGGHGRSASFTFRASGGIRTVDLDDLDYDENTGIYSASCRCGNPRAYRFTEDDLDAFEADGVLMVECLDCSLWLRVLFAPVDEDEDGKGNEASAAATVAAATSEKAKEKDKQQRETEANEQRMSRKNGEGLQRSISRQGSSGGGKWSFNWSVNFGISVGGSASATTSSGGGGGGDDDRDKGVSRR